MSGVVNKGHFFATATEAWSYATCIRTTTADGISVVNRSHYSKTTELHQKLDGAMWRGKPHVLVTNAKMEAGPNDLLELAQQGLDELRAGIA